MTARDPLTVEHEIKSLQYMAKNSAYGHNAELTRINGAIRVALGELRGLHGALVPFAKRRGAYTFQVKTRANMPDAVALSMILILAKTGTIAGCVKLPSGAYHLTIRDSPCEDIFDVRRVLIVNEWIGDSVELDIW